TPAGTNYVGPDTFTYQVSDGYLTSSVATVTLALRPRLSVISWLPQLNTPHIASDGTLVLRFNHPLDSNTLAGQISMHGSDTGARAFTSNLTGDTLTLSPDSPLLFGEQVTISLGVGLQGTAGESLGAGITAVFEVEEPTGQGTFTDSGQRLGDTNT